MDLSRFFQFLNLIHRRQDFLHGGSTRRKVATYTQNNTNRQYTHTDIHILSGIRTHDPSVQANEDSTYLRQRGRCDRRMEASG
jgi:hypothetical protein